jgi:periplasmic copper chaperone A
MRKSILLVACVVALFASIANAKDVKAGALEIDSPWSRAVPRGASVAAGCLTTKNAGTAPDRLVGASTAVAGQIEIQEMTFDNSVMIPVPTAPQRLV